MKVLIKNAKVLQQSSSYHGDRLDIMVENGKINAIDSAISKSADHIIQSEDTHISLGWVDIGCHSGQPGNEQRETLKSLSEAGAKGGYTHLFISPDTQPVLDNRMQVEYLQRFQSDAAVQLHTLGALSHGLLGKDLSEMLDMAEAGCKVFTDTNRSEQHTNLLQRGLEYAKSNDLCILQSPFDPSLAIDGHMHEGKQSTMLGLPGIPSISEHQALSKLIDLQKYTESKLIAHLISCKESVALIKKAKSNSNKISCTLAYQNLVHTDKALYFFDSNFKVFPPLRSDEDREELKNALLDGTIDILCSNHTPLEEEKKKLEFPYADFGMTSLEVCFSKTLETLGKENLDIIIKAISNRPRQLMGISEAKIEIGARADLTIFDPSQRWTYLKSKSLSKNNPYFGQELNGSVIATILENQININ